MRRGQEHDMLVGCVPWWSERKPSSLAKAFRDRRAFLFLFRNIGRARVQFDFVFFKEMFLRLE